MGLFISEAYYKPLVFYDTLEDMLELDWDIDKITGNNIFANLKKYKHASMACLSSRV